jgi:hypothetical protein
MGLQLVPDLPPCKPCQGQGWVATNEPQPNGSYVIDCPDCEGTGKDSDVVSAGMSKKIPTRPCPNPACKGGRICTKRYGKVVWVDCGTCSGTGRVLA